MASATAEEEAAAAAVVIITVNFWVDLLRRVSQINSTSLRFAYGL